MFSFPRFHSRGCVSEQHSFPLLFFSGYNTVLVTEAVWQTGTINDLDDVFVFVYLGCSSTISFLDINLLLLLAWDAL